MAQWRCSQAFEEYEVWGAGQRCCLVEQNQLRGRRLSNEFVCTHPCRKSEVGQWRTEGQEKATTTWTIPSLADCRSARVQRS